ncbi:MAG: IS110 family transposase [Caldilineaceae bacterium SB0662_bin_9]|uniref:IS110 family transposase n=1 Tax=Caldilineaceae bacterium SB0662_bin_9 TaxID=2605258 RepID=A0A6B1DZL8_9CHLR|nr:IS110 family transposase [Caldilineaceae bacterium SB0662_bin_9]
MANTHVGIDVSQHQIDLAVQGAEDGDGLPHDQESLETLSDRLTALAPDGIVMEATGGLEVLLATSLQDIGLPVVAVRLCQARAFGRASWSWRPWWLAPHTQHVVGSPLPNLARNRLLVAPPGGFPLKGHNAIR